MKSFTIKKMEGGDMYPGQITWVFESSTIQFEINEPIEKPIFGSTLLKLVRKEDINNLLRKIKNIYLNYADIKKREYILELADIVNIQIDSSKDIKIIIELETDQEIRYRSLSRLS